MEFANKGYLLLLLLLIPYIIWYVMYSKKSEPTFRLADTNAFRNISTGLRVFLMPLLFVLRIVAFTLLVIALARPQTSSSWRNESIEGINIMLAIDVSTSMLAEDMRDDQREVNNRIEAAKSVAAEFINARPNDNIGLTVFAGEAYTQCPMTNDRTALFNMLFGIRADIAARGLIEDGTAIGMGLANAISRLKESEAKSKVVILLTDGENNRGDISPMTAAEIAKSLGIRVYTIGVGAEGTAPYPTVVAGQTRYVTMETKIDTKTLADIASATGGQFYRATNTKDLSQIYQEIDQLEKSKISVRQYSELTEAYQLFALAAVIALALELLLRVTILRRIP